MMLYMYAAGEWKLKFRSPKPPLFKLSCACCQVAAEASTAVHSEKHFCTQSSNRAKASLTTRGGVFLAKSTSLQKLPHC